MIRNWLCITLFVSGLAGCANDIVHKPGGLPGMFANYFFPANNREVRLLRAYTFMAAAAQVGASKYEKEPAELDEFLRDYKKASAELNVASNCLAQEYCAFETVMRGYYHSFNDVAKNLVSHEEWETIASFSNPLDFYEKPEALKKIVSRGLSAGGDISAVYRDALQLRMDIAIGSLSENDPLRKKLIAIRDVAEPDYGEWNKEIKKVAYLKPQAKHYEAIKNLVQITCKRLVSTRYRLDGERVYDECFGNSANFFKVYEAVYKPDVADTIVNNAVQEQET